MLSELPSMAELFSKLWMPVQTPLMNAISMNNVNNLGLKTDILNSNPYLFNNEIVNKNLPITNQRSSGRCWLFASSNLIRSVSFDNLKEKYGEIENFELSQKYLFFWDKFERYHRSLLYFVDIHKEEENKDRYLYQLLNDPLGDGGQWDMAKDIIKKYGVVPKAVYPDSHHAKSSRQMNKILTAQLKSDFSLLKENLNDPSLTDMINMMSKRTYKLLISFLGKPPDKFSWTFKDTKGNSINSIKTMTPIDFLNELGFNPDEWVSIVNDPRENHFYDTYYQVKYLGNVFDKHVGWLNLEMDRLINLTKESIDQKIPVWFGCDMGAETDSSSGVKHPDIIDLKGVLGTNIKMNKEERLETYSSLPNHAMMITGYHEDEGNIERWKIENSWGKDSGKDGYCLMTNDWMKEYVFQILVKKDLLTKDEQKVLEVKDDYKTIEPWDPLGTLA
tara:strand:+ start:1200 stop:2537 length:1338 start_codon:yes stop_codon:yes gene_type:complete